MHTDWTFRHPKMTLEHLGFIPTFLSETDSRPAKEQFNANYVAGWYIFCRGKVGEQPAPGERSECFRMLRNGSIVFPGDPALPVLAETRFRNETIRFYQSSWVAIVQEDGSFEICRMD